MWRWYRLRCRLLGNHMLLQPWQIALIVIGGVLIISAVVILIILFKLKCCCFTCFECSCLNCCCCADDSMSFSCSLSALAYLFTSFIFSSLYFLCTSLCLVFPRSHHNFLENFQSHISAKKYQRCRQPKEVLSAIRCIWQTDYTAHVYVVHKTQTIHCWQ